MKRDLSYYKRIFDDLGRGEPAPLYLLSGPETYVMEEYATRLVDTLVTGDMRSFNFTLAYGAEVDIEEFLSAANSYPFLADRRVMVLKELERLRGGWDNLITYCANPVPSTVLVMLVGSHDETGRKLKPPRNLSKLARHVQSSGLVQQFDKLGERDLERWVHRKARRMELQLDPEAVQALVGSVGENLWNIQNELEKLSLLYAGGRVAVNDLVAVLGSYRLNVLYDLIGHVDRGREDEALRVLSRILNTGAERPSVVVYFLIRHFLSLLRRKAGVDAGKDWGGRDGRMDGRYGVREIIIWLENLRIAELIMKSESFPEEILITSVILHSMRGETLRDNSEFRGVA